MSGEVVHFGIPADDVERANSFYRDAFGWAITTIPEMGYSLVSTAPSGEDGRPIEPGAINGGMLARQAPFAGPVVVVDVDDIEEALQRIEELGGKTVIPKQPVGETGYSAYFTDTEANLIGLWESAAEV